MEILFNANDDREGKILSNHLAGYGHATTWRNSTAATLRELEARIWDIEIVICRIKTQNPCEGVRLAEAISDIRARRGYHHRPFLILISSQVDELLYRAATLAGASLWKVENNYEKLFSYLDVIREQELHHYLNRPCLVIRHGIHIQPNVNCDGQERLRGIWIESCGREYSTDQTPKTAVLIDYLSRQRYAKTEKEISDGIASNPFYMAQLRDDTPPAGAIKRLIQRSRETLEPALKKSQSKATADMLIRNVAGHTRMYKFDGLVKVVHSKESCQ